MISADVLGVDGGKTGRKVELPAAFSAEIDEGLIRRAVLSIQSARFQPKAPKKGAGISNTSVYVGARKKPQRYRTINIDAARLPRLKNRRFLIAGNVASVPQAVGGATPHPPKVEKNLHEKINKKEKRKALESAIAASVDEKTVKERGHKFGAKLPVVVEGKFENLEKTKEVAKALSALKLWDDVERAKAGRKIRAGKGKKRGRKYKRAKSLLIVVEKPEKIFMAARNIEGVDIVSAKNLNAELLAPGAKAGRLTLWTEPAIKHFV